MAAWLRRNLSKNPQKSGAQAGSIYSEVTHVATRSETTSERTLGAFLEPFALSDRSEAVHQIAGAGYQTVLALAVLDEDTLVHIGLSERDAHRIMLASWLHTLALDNYGERLVDNGCDSLIKLVALSEDGLRRAGVNAIGPRRQILRHSRDDAALLAMVESAKAKAEQEGGAAVSHARGLWGVRKVDGPGKRAGPAGSGPGGGARVGAGAQAALQIGAPQPSAPLPSGHVPDAYMKRDAWDDRWKITANASLGSTNGHTEAHHAARTPREFRMVMADGSEMTVS